jgi:hypothetical protein
MRPSRNHPRPQNIQGAEPLPVPKPERGRTTAAGERGPRW